MADEVPDDSFEHYQILRRPEDGSQWVLGRGNMGITYKAVDTRLQVMVALKIMNAQCADNERTFKYFLREARAAAALNHRNIARVIHLSDKREKCFYAMEFIDGETIAEFVRRQGRLSAAEALPIVQQVARALTAAHDKQLVHRDIKPANIMLVNEVDEAAVVKLIDFGLAKSFVQEGNPLFFSYASGFTGTYEFASPEQISEESLDCRSDIYSLGVTLWYMLTGASPFQGTQFSVSSQHLESPPPFHKLPGDVPPKVTELLARMLAKRPDDRPQTPVALRLEVKDILESIDFRSAAGLSTPPDTVLTSGQTSSEPPVNLAKNGFHTVPMVEEPLHEMPVISPPGADAPAPVVARADGESSQPFEDRISDPAIHPEEAATIVDFANQTAIAVVVGQASLVPEAEIPADESAVEVRPDPVPAIGDPPPILEVPISENPAAQAAPEPVRIETSPSVADAPASEIEYEEQPVFIDALLPVAAEEVPEIPDSAPPIPVAASTETPLVEPVGEKAEEVKPDASPVSKPVFQYRSPPPLSPEETAGPPGKESDSTAWLIVAGLAVVLAIAVLWVWWYVRPGPARPRRPTVALVTPPPTGTPSLKSNFVVPGSPAAVRPTVAPTPAPAVVEATLKNATRQRPYINSLGMKFVPLPGTKLLICTHPATRKNYAAFAQANRLEHREWEKPEIDGIPVSQGDDYPVVMVSWSEANEFCEWLSRTEAGTAGVAAIYRLPSVEEWRLARGSGNYPWGNEWPPPAGAGNYADVTASAAFQGRPHRLTPIAGYNDGFATTSPVNSFSANALGLHDIGGNVRQWCLNLDSQGFWQYMGSSWHDADRPALMAKEPGGQSRNAPRTTQLGFRCVLEILSE